jgi:hypothetical protein
MLRKSLSNYKRKMFISFSILKFSKHISENKIMEIILTCKHCGHLSSDHFDDGDDIFKCMLCTCDASSKELGYDSEDLEIEDKDGSND